MTKKKTLPKDPRDYYVSNQVSIKALSELYKGRKGCKPRQLEERSRLEKWGQLRRDLREKTAEKVIEKTSEEIAKKQAKTLAELNDGHLKRVETLIKLNEQLIQQALKTVIDPATGETKVFLDMRPTDLRRITSSIIDAQAAERLYNNYAPKAPVDEVGPDKPENGDKPEVDPLIAALMGNVESDWAEEIANKNSGQADA